MVTRRRFLYTGAMLAGTTLLSPQQLLAAWLQRPQGDMQLLRRNVGIFTERGGTIAWLLDPQGIAVVDTQFPEQAGHLIEHIRQQSQKPFDLVLNTHHHGDHTGGNIRSWIQALRNIQKAYAKDTVFVFGHSGEGHGVVGTRLEAL